MFKTLLTIFLLSPVVQADDLLDVLDGGAKVNSDKVVPAEPSVFKSIISRPTAEQNIFLQFLQKGEVKKALYQWPSAFEGTSFAKSDTGKALYGYLLFKNNLKLVGLETLFQTHPKQINKDMVELWQSTMQVEDKIWSLTDVRWASEWTDIFGISAEVAVMAREFEQELPLSQLEKLLRKTPPNSWERNWTEWRYITSLLLEGQDVKAAKLLKHLQSVKENNPISTNLMDITAARMLYQNGYLSQAIRYYQKVSKKSDYWFQALEEMGWSELRLGQPQNTLAHMKTLMTPAFEPDVGPETFYLSSLAHLKVCDYTEVSETLKEFRSRFQRKTKVLLDLEETPESKAVKTLFARLEKTRVSMDTLGEAGVLLPRYSTRDEALFYLVQRHVALSQEGQIAQKLYSQSLSEGTALVGFQAKMERFKKMVLSQARNSYTASLNRVKFLAKEEIEEISSVLKKMQIVEAELIQQLALSDRVIEDTKDVKEKVQKGTTGSTSRETLKFPFQGEVWFDEISNYRIDIAKGCQAGKEKAL